MSKIALMDLHAWITQQHFLTHFVLDSQVLAKLDDSQLRARPAGDGNSVAWLLWHVTRCEDVAVNAIIRGAPQVLGSEDWRARLGVDSGQIGTGMGDTEVSDLTSSVDLRALLDYRSAVRKSTAAWIGTIDPSALDAVPNLDDRLAATGRLWPEAGEWVRDMWKPWPAGVFLNWVAIGHTMMHIGEMQTAMTQLGIEGR